MLAALLLLESKTICPLAFASVGRLVSKPAKYESPQSGHEGMDIPEEADKPVVCLYSLMASQNGALSLFLRHLDPLLHLLGAGKHPCGVAFHHRPWGATVVGHWRARQAYPNWQAITALPIIASSSNGGTKTLSLHGTASTPLAGRACAAHWLPLLDAPIRLRLTLGSLGDSAFPGHAKRNKSRDTATSVTVHYR